MPSIRVDCVCVCLYLFVGFFPSYNCTYISMGVVFPCFHILSEKETVALVSQIVFNDLQLVHFSLFEIQDSPYKLWESLSLEMLGFCPTSALFRLTLHTGDPICCSQRFQRELRDPSEVSHPALPPVSWTHWRMVAESVTVVRCGRHISQTEAPLVALDERWYHPVRCHLVSSFVLIQWQISLRGEQQWQIVSVACFWFLLSWRDAIDIGCIDWAIIAILETARVRGVGVGRAYVHAVL